MSPSPPPPPKKQKNNKQTKLMKQVDYEEKNPFLLKM